MKRFGLMGLAALTALALMAGCRSGGAENYRELSDAERIELELSARNLVIQSKVVPEHLRSVFAEIPGHERIVYSGDKAGRAEYRWEIYDSPAGSKMTQKDVNPFWVRVFAEGDLTRPKWKLTHSRDWTPPGAGSSGGQPRRERRMPGARPGDTVRYRR